MLDMTTAEEGTAATMTAAGVTMIAGAGTMTAEAGTMTAVVAMMIVVGVTTVVTGMTTMTDGMTAATPNRRIDTTTAVTDTTTAETIDATTVNGTIAAISQATLNVENSPGISGRPMYRHHTAHTAWCPAADHLNVGLSSVVSSAYALAGALYSRVLPCTPHRSQAWVQHTRCSGADRLDVM
eukprot:m.235451 g.235451  ORF g.235451 m.235451 type:complete len:182 (-) comp15761_c0_seq3:4052-4597(-)